MLTFLLGMFCGFILLSVVIALCRIAALNDEVNHDG